MELHKNAVFFIGLDIDALPISVGAGEGVPGIAIWENGKPRECPEVPDDCVMITRQRFEAIISAQTAS